MDAAKKSRTNCARKLTRKSNELSNAIRGRSHISEIQEKIGTLKYCMEELGTVHDEYMGHFDVADEEVQTQIQKEDRWYMNYDMATNEVIKEARDYIDYVKAAHKTGHEDAKQVKLKKIEVPTFSGHAKDYYKWKSIFERYMKNRDDETKYDYLITSTTGEAKTYVENKATYAEAILRLDEKYGNIHVIMGILINDIKSLQIVRKGDFKSFEQLSLKVDEFYDRLKLMGKEDDVENSYVLKEIESKLCYEDMQKWLESMGENVDERRVQNLMKWLESQAHLRKITHNYGGSPRYIPPPLRNNTTRVSASTSAVNVCQICSSSDHNLADCPDYLNMSNNDRWERIKLLRCCFVCLKSGHRSFDCIEPVCNACTRPHHITLHRFRNDNMSSSPVSHATRILLPPQEDKHEQQPTVANPMSTKQTNKVTLSRSLLPVLRARAFSAHRGKQCTIGLDSYSEINIITERCANQLGLVGDPFNVQITGAGGVKTITKSRIVKVSVVDNLENPHEIECVVLPKACGRALHLDLKQFDILKQKELEEKKVYTRGGEVEILIGMPQPILQENTISPFVHNLCIMKTLFGHTLVGENKTDLNKDKCTQYNSNCISILPEHPDEKLWRNHLQSELAGISPIEKVRTEDDEQFDQKFKINMMKENGHRRLQVSLAWKTNPEQFQNNRHQAVECDKKLVKQLGKDKVVEHLFDKQFDEMKEMNIVRKVPKEFPKRFLPILAVIDLECESTKVRVCLDAKRRYNGVSFNDYLHKGKLEMVDIFELLTAFRSGYVALQGDIKKMFWQISLSEYDQQFHGIIYKGETYVFTRVCFGDKPSPTIANDCMKKIAKEEKEDFPFGSWVIVNRRFVDDIIDAGIKSSNMIQKRDETHQLLGKYKFDVKEWISNKDDVGKVKRDGKVLGVHWDGAKDVLTAKIKAVGNMIDFTKRNVLKKIAEVWDPLGILSGVVATGKLIFQSIVRMKLDWDQNVPDDDLRIKWQQLVSELEKCDGFCIPRSILPSEGNIDDMQFELIGFGDGSSCASGATVYLRWHDVDELNIEVKFLGAKGKVNPIKGTTVPRSELCGSVLVSRLVNSAESVLKNSDLNKFYKEKLLFSDSTTVLSWLKSASIKYKPFVKNKVMECQELHPIDSWKFIYGKDNTSADLISKGCKFKDLGTIVNGPELLRQKREEWPLIPNEKNEEEINSEKCAKLNVNTTSVDKDPIDITRFKSWRKLVRSTALVQKFIKLKVGQQVVEIVDDVSDVQPNLNDEDIEKAEMYWIRKAQKNLDLSSTANQQLNPFTDENGIFRVGGRLKNMPVFDESRKHPILLPKNHEISRLITQDAHENCIHPGHLRVMAEVRKKYWILGLRFIAKSIGKHCVTCKRWRRLALEQKMADLPSFRLDVRSRPFENTAIDYFGPLVMKYGHRSRCKAFGVIFTCLTTRAIHTELATDLSTDTFLLALDRFINVYKKPKFVRSDNGSNFIGAAKELKEMIDSWKTDTAERKKLVNICNLYGIKWTFSTPLASHHNGAVESMVKSVKTSLNKLLKDQAYKEEEYRTIFSKVTAIVNSRPLWPVSEGDVDQPPITPNDLLRPTGIQRDPEDVELSLSRNPRKRFDHIQRVCDDWWKIWLLHFTPNLQCRTKWYKERSNVEVGDIVLLIDPSVKRSKWNMGVVEKVYTGSDDLVRSVSVRTKTGTYDRPISKLTLLVSKEEQSDSE